MKNIFAILFALVLAGTANAQPAPAAASAKVAPAAPASGKVNVIHDAPAPAAASKVHVAPLPPASGYVVTREGSEDVNIVLRNDCQSGGCPSAAPPAPAPGSTTKPDSATGSEQCTLGLCLFTTIASWIGAVGAYLLEGIIILGILLGAAYFFFRWLPEHRRDNRWHRRAARRRGAYRVARRRFDDAGDGTAEKAMWGDRMERRWARYTGFTRTADHDVDEDCDLPPPPDLGDEE